MSSTSLELIKKLKAAQRAHAGKPFVGGFPAAREACKRRYKGESLPHVATSSFARAATAPTKAQHREAVQASHKGLARMLRFEPFGSVPHVAKSAHRSAMKRRAYATWLQSSLQLKAILRLLCGFILQINNAKKSFVELTLF